MPVALFRADASQAIGGGHVMRCLTLATRLKATGWQVMFAGTAETVATAPALKGWPFLAIPAGLNEADEARFLVEALEGNKQATPDWLVVDHYHRGARLESALRTAWGCRVLAIDDLANRPHDADLLLDQTFGRKASDYEPHVPPQCHVLLGSNYALLRDEFTVVRGQLSERRTQPLAHRVIVHFGLTDPDNLTGQALPVLAEILAGRKSENWSIAVMIGSAAPHLASLKMMATSMPVPVEILTDCTHVAEQYLRADIGVGAAGSSSWERCAMGLPSLVLAWADNQRLILRNLVEAGAALSIDNGRGGLDISALHTHMERVIAEPELRQSMAARALSLCDAGGAERVAAAMQEVMAGMNVQERCDG